MVRDMSKHALGLSLQPGSTEEQMRACREMLRKPVSDPARYDAVWEQQVKPLDGAYEMNP